MNFNLSFLRRKLSRLLPASFFLFTVGTGLSINTHEVLAAEEIVLTYSFLDQPVLVKDLENFVETGEVPTSLKLLIGLSKQDPEDVRQALTQEVSLDNRFLYKVFNTLPGEYVLFQVGQIIHPRYKPNPALIPALRGTLILSASDDGKISLLEFFQKYPTKEMYVDGRLIAKTAGDVFGFLNRAEEALEVPIAIAKDFLEDLVCECEVTTSTTDSGVIQVEANSSQK
ncbi:MAG: alpha/beta hydrolase [Xenococcus sp. (in: cyanobacteria)]